MGMLTKQEKENDARLLNPTQRSLERTMHKCIRHKVLSALVSEEETAAYRKQMFVESEYIPAETERTAHKDIPPASVRIRNFKCKEMPLLDAAVKEIKARDTANYMKKIEAKEKGERTGFYFSNMGSVYDVPAQAGDAEAKT